MNPFKKSYFGLVEILIIIGILALLTLTACKVEAQDKAWYSDPIGFAQHTSDAKGLSVALYPSYAPNIVTDGKKDQFGAGVALLYPVFSETLGGHGFMGGRIDFLGSQFWAPSATLGFQADIQLFGHNVRPFAIGGSIFPLSGAGDKNGSVGAIVGGGFYTTLIAFGKDDAHPDGKARLGLFYEAEHWTLYPGIVHHGGLALTASF